VENVTTAARIKGRELIVFDAGTEREVETAFIGMALRRVRALVVGADGSTNLRRERQLEGIAKAKAAGVCKGRPASIDAAQVRAMKARRIFRIRQTRHSVPAAEQFF
jgi:hypothetical protein